MDDEQDWSPLPLPEVWGFWLTVLGVPALVCVVGLVAGVLA